MPPCDHSPWVEKYRPKRFEDIVLDPWNRAVIEGAFAGNYFPNLLLYGPPGTGKTTTIINLVNRFQEAHGQKNKGLMIHLNASDERGIDVIRTQINQFVNTSPLFGDGLKFVILDEVDYMTKNAQQALKYLLQGFSTKVRFCLICNYISRIDEALQNEFVRLQFSRLPTDSVIAFLESISAKENLDYSRESIESIQNLYKSDMRSMINYMQSNRDLTAACAVIGRSVWRELTQLLEDGQCDKATVFLADISDNYSIDARSVIEGYLNYVIRHERHHISTDFLKLAEFVVHGGEACPAHVNAYAALRMAELFAQVKNGGHSEPCEESLLPTAGR
jgi:DNA polymerase III delta prime subunit